jgi:hypothetical protein
MPPRLHPVTRETVARRLELQPDTVTFEAARTLFNGLGLDAEMDGHRDLKAEAYALGISIQDLIETPEADGLVASARMILAVDDLIDAAQDLRTDVAGAYDRFDRHTARATEALEILTAIGVQLEAADFELRTGTRAA